MRATLTPTLTIRRKFASVLYLSGLKLKAKLRVTMINGAILYYAEWPRLSLSSLAGVQGFEPQLADPESAVLPLNDTPMS